eukprot:m51a1_g1500 hypothetical protein (376) ;mRNA; r:350247-351678
MKLELCNRAGRKYYVFKPWHGRAGDPDTESVAQSLAHGRVYSIASLRRLETTGAILRAPFAPDIVLVAKDAPELCGGRAQGFWKLLQRRCHLKHASKALDRGAMPVIRDIEAWLKDTAPAEPMSCLSPDAPAIEAAGVNYELPGVDSLFPRPPPDEPAAGPAAPRGDDDEPAAGPAAPRGDDDEPAVLAAPQAPVEERTDASDSAAAAAVADDVALAQPGANVSPAAPQVEQGFGDDDSDVVFEDRDDQLSSFALDDQTAAATPAAPAVAPAPAEGPEEVAEGREAAPRVKVEEQEQEQTRRQWEDLLAGVPVPPSSEVSDTECGSQGSVTPRAVCDLFPDICGDEGLYASDRYLVAPMFPDEQPAADFALETYY